ncbi:Hypp1583 [Branchiostoma lanceolatum]|uniref:Hypp1583 protein n=1 Tax=Branchiostoma lanceolatum TaxID=7740 RepID=A0A8J9ZJ34_BRALA|nr:Hypp1583 [Branchiostoma lanceolatum]
MLQDFDVELLIGILSYDQKADIFNYVHKYNQSGKNIRGKERGAKKEDNDNSGFSSRRPMDRRRFEEAHLLFAYLNVVSTYGVRKDSEIDYSTNNMCDSISSDFHEAFVKRWSVHRCTVAGCDSCIVLDGNAKNHRQVCSVKDASVQFPLLPGSVKTGCINTPAKGSRFCEKCREFACDPKGKTEEAVTELKVEAHLADDPYLIEEILDKKSFRTTTLYKVRRFQDKEEVWEREDCVPKRMVSKFERGLQRQLQPRVLVDHSFGVVTNNVQLTEDTADDNPKRRKGGSDLFQTSGFAVEKDGDLTVKDDDGERGIKCNTQKDKSGVRLNAISAGVLAFLKPCNIILGLHELYLAESKSQVYGHLHSLLSRSEMGKTEYIIYDDACHLRKFARNPARSDATETTRRLANMEMLVDRMHMRGHVDPWCKKHCGTWRFEDLDLVK